jgi:uncharacterized protein YodC (DUF2158 family)
MQRGDIVRLKGVSGPQMIVTGRRNEAVDLIWFKTDNTYCNGTFNQDLLEVVPTKPLYCTHGNWAQGLGKINFNLDSFAPILTIKEPPLRITSKDFKIGKKYKCVGVGNKPCEVYLDMIVCCLEKDHKTRVEDSRCGTILKCKSANMIGNSYNWTESYKFEEVNE